MHELAAQLTQFLRQPAPPVSTLVLMLNNFSYRVSFATEDQASIRAGLLTLLQICRQLWSACVSLTANS